MATPRKSGLPVPPGDQSPTSKAKPTLSGRRSQTGLRQSLGSSVPVTPKRLHDNGRTTPSFQEIDDSNGVSTKRKLEIGDFVCAEVNQTKFFGVLRHLGPVHFRPGVFAGLELTGESEGKGKNDGSIEGQQYFACEPGNGMFCPASKVKIQSQARSKEATPRPQSSLSLRSGRSSVTDENSTLRSTTPSRPRSSLSYRPSSATPGRTASRHSMGRPGSSLANSHRLQPRKSVADGLADEEDRRRAKASAEEAKRAEERITEGSRAHKFLNMSARDLQANRTAPAKPSAPTAERDSPLKQNLLGPKTTPRIPRVSAGSALHSSNTPRALKSRSSQISIQGKNQSTEMPPPLVFPATAARTPGKVRPPEASEETSQRNMSLLEQMDLLTPKRQTQKLSPRISDRESANEDAPGDEAGFVPLPFDDDEGAEESPVDGVAQGMVPLALYEESNLEVMRLKSQLQELQFTNEEKQKREIERIKVASLEEARKELEEERKVEKEDESRRRRNELKEKESEWSAKLEKLKKETKQLEEDNQRSQAEHARQKAEIEVRLKESEELAQKMKETTTAHDADDIKGQKSQGELQAKDIEIEQLNQRLLRFEGQKEEEHQQHLKEIDELKAAGQEALDMFDRESTVSQERISELESKMHMLEARAQEAIAEAERQRDEALQSTSRSVSNTVAEIDQKSLQDQLEQAHRRTTLLEDQLGEANALLAQERETHKKRSTRYHEHEAKLKEDVAKYKVTIQHLEQSEAGLKRQKEEANEALEESRAALENERAELETLRAEALIMGEGPDGQAVHALEKGRFEAEIERLHGLLEGARSGKREARRQADESRLQKDELYALLEEARSHLRTTEDDKSHLVDEIASRSHRDASIIAGLRRDLEMMRKSNKPLPEQVDSMLKSVNKEIVSKDEEIYSLRKRLDELARRTGSQASGATFGIGIQNLSPSRGASIDSDGSPSRTSGLLTGSHDSHNSGLGVNNITSPSLSNNKRFSTASSQSRRSYGSATTGDRGSAILSSSEGMAKELTGLRSLVGTLNQELTDVKVNNTQQQRELKDQVEHYKKECQRLELRVQSEPALQTGAGADVDTHQQLEKNLRKAHATVERLERQLAAVEEKKKAEVEKLNQDIAELEVLCEATVWRREEQEAKREELERKVAKLERQLDRAQEHEQRHRTGVPPMPQHTRQTSATKESLDFSQADIVVCDNCGEKGHKMEHCPYVNDDMLF